jgi:hypothetical protein
MIDTRVAAPAKSSSLGLYIDGVEVDVRGSSDVLGVLASIYRRHRRDGKRNSDVVRGVRLRLPSERGAAAALAAAAAERIVRSVAECTARHVIRAAALERNGRALLIAGSPGCGKSTLAVNLLSGGWKLLADDYVLISSDGGTAIAHQALMTLPALSTPHVPAIFRKAIEYSHWHCAQDGQDLRFYEVDPTLVFGDKVWSERARLDAIVLLTRSADNSRMRTIDTGSAAQELGSHVPADLKFAPDVRMGSIAPSRAAHCAEAVDAWFDAHCT